MNFLNKILNIVVSQAIVHLQRLEIDSQSLLVDSQQQQQQLGSTVPPIFQCGSDSAQTGPTAGAGAGHRT